MIHHNILIPKVEVANDDSTNGSKDADMLEESLAKEPIKGKENITFIWPLERNHAFT